ncbi:MAG: hypothetical protein NXY57DRAFT_670579 [Lentinula lateritia]|nr:MAG: hypothetical protein NXY57DRAFT_670579 [Lentinula lateritia]
MVIYKSNLRFDTVISCFALAAFLRRTVLILIPLGMFSFWCTCSSRVPSVHPYRVHAMIPTHMRAPRRILRIPPGPHSTLFYLRKVQESILAQHHPLLPRAANPLSFPLCFGVLEVQRTCGGVTIYRTDLASEFLRPYADAWDAIDKLTCCGWTTEVPVDSLVKRGHYLPTRVLNTAKNQQKFDFITHPFDVEPA